MINKLPVVGERYVYKTAKDSKGFLAGLFKSEGIFTFDGGTILRFVPEHFWNIFEELPDSNPQEEPNLLAKDGWCGGREPLPTREEFYERLREQNKTESVDLEKGEVSEVERALEELKYKLNNPVCDTGVLRIKAQKLVNALEAEKAKTHQLNTPVSREYTPAPEPKIDMKEECVEPVNTTITVGFEPNGRVMTPYEQIEEILEQIQKDIEELKQQIR